MCLVGTGTNATKHKETRTTAGEADKTEQILGNVLTNATKHKETTVHKRYRQNLSSSGARRETDNKRRRKQREVPFQEGADVHPLAKVNDTDTLVCGHQQPI